MLRHVMYIMFAVMLGVAVMLLPLMMRGYQDGFTKYSQPQYDEATKTFTSSSEERVTDNAASKEGFDYTTVQGYKGLLTRFISSLPYAMFIVVAGLTVAITIMILARRRLS